MNYEISIRHGGVETPWDSGMTFGVDEDNGLWMLDAGTLTVLRVFATQDGAEAALARLELEIEAAQDKGGTTVIVIDDY